MISILTAFTMDMILGDPYWFPHPVRIIGIFVTSMEKLIRKVFMYPKGLKLGGVILALSTVFITFATVALTLHYSKKVHTYLFWGINIIFLWTSIAPKTLKVESIKVYKALKENDISKARILLSYIVGRDTTNLNDSEIAKAAVETVAENTSDGVIAPLIYMFLGGAPLALAYKAINTLDSMVGYKNEKYIHLGWASAKLDDIANFIPARITGILIIISSAILGLDTQKSFLILKRDHLKHSSPNAGYPEAATAGALNIQLGGANYYHGKLVDKPTIGDDTKEISHEDIKKVNSLMYTSAFLALMIFLVISILVK